MRNDQIAVLLRDFARRALEWASILEKQEPGDPVVDRAFIEHGTFSVSLPTDPTTPIPPTGATTPDSSNVGNGGDSLPAPTTNLTMAREIRRRAGAPYSTQDTPQSMQYNAVVDAERLPTTFTCPSCGRLRTYPFDGLPGPNWVCANCFRRGLRPTGR